MVREEEGGVPCPFHCVVDGSKTLACMCMSMSVISCANTSLFFRLFFLFLAEYLREISIFFLLSSSISSQTCPLNCQYQTLVQQQNACMHACMQPRQLAACRNYQLIVYVSISAHFSAMSGDLVNASGLDSCYKVIHEINHWVFAVSVYSSVLNNTSCYC